MRKKEFFGIFLVSLLLSACSNTSSDGNWKEKVKFDLELMKTAGEESKLLGYSFCVPDEPVLVEQLRQIHTELEVIDRPEQSCDSTHFLCRFHPVQPAHVVHLEKIARLSYISEIHPVWR